MGSAGILPAVFGILPNTLGTACESAPSIIQPGNMPGPLNETHTKVDAFSKHGHRHAPRDAARSACGRRRAAPWRDALKEWRTLAAMAHD